MPNIECIQRLIGRKFYKSKRTSFKLTLKGGLLPAWESSLILRDDDQVIVEQEATSHSSSKKRKSMTHSPKPHLTPSAKHKSPGCIQTKNTGTSVGNEESILATETLQNSVATPSTEIEEPEKRSRKKKKKSEGANELDIEEIPAPNKKQKISKSPKNEHKRKKMTVTKETQPEFMAVVIDHVNVVSSLSENQKEEEVNLCDKSDSSRDLNKAKSELIKMLDEVSVISDKAIPKKTSDTFSSVKDVSKVVPENSSEGNTSFTQVKDSIEKSLIEDVESNMKSDLDTIQYNIQEESSSHSALEKGNTSLTQLTDSKGRGWRKKISDNSGISDVKSYNVKKRSPSHSVQENIEVYNIATEDLNNICQSLSEGETLTIDQDKVKVIDVENSSNSSWLDCVEVDSKSTAPETSKSSGNIPRRRRRRRGQRSFACSPFIHEMSQNLDSEVDNRSPLSTPVARQSNERPSSSNNSQKHFHFESDTEEDVEESIAQQMMTESGDSKTENNFDCSKSTLSSDKTVTNGAEDSDSSFVSQGGKEKDRILSSSQKQTPKKSVHFALENNSFQSFDSKQGPVIYKRGQNPSQRRAYPTLIRQQQLNSVEDDRDTTTSVNCPNPKPLKEYNLLPAIVGYPRAGDKIAFKRLEIGADYTPRLSDFNEAKVMSFQEDTKMLTMKVTSSQNNRKKDGKFELFYDDDKDLMIFNQEDITETVELSTLQDVKLLK